MRSFTFGLALLVGCPAAADAAPATSEEATRLTALFGAYLPATASPRPGLNVTPQGEGYLVALDLGRLMAPFLPAGTSLTTGDLAATLTPQPDGRWGVRLDGLPPIGLVPGAQTTSWTFEGYTVDGVFDPALRAFATLSLGSRGSTTHTVSPGETMDARLMGTTTSTGTGVPAGDGLATLSMSSEGKALDYLLDVAPKSAAGTAGGGPAAGFHAEAKVASFSSDAKWERAPTVALDALWRFLAANPSRAALTAAQAELKERLRTVTATGGLLAGGAALRGISVDTKLGTFTLDDVTERLAFAPGAAGSTPSIAVAFSGLHLPAGLVPPFAAPLVPTGLDLSLSYGPLDLADPLRGAIDLLDLAAPTPIGPAQGRTLLEAVGAANAAVTLGPSTLTLPTMTLKARGVTRLVQSKPVGSASVSVVGLDRTVAAIQAATPNDPTAKQAVLMLLAAKALARAEGPDSYAWEIESLPGGTVTVNGTSLGDIAPHPKPGKP